MYSIMKFLVSYELVIKNHETIELSFCESICKIQSLTFTIDLIQYLWAYEYNSFSFDENSMTNILFSTYHMSQSSPGLCKQPWHE